MKFGVVVFPGSNCDHDTYHVISKIVGQPVQFIWHKSISIDDCDVVILPGGFSYGDYLRCGALASLSPIMQTIKVFASRGGLILGICNGFQILCEAGLLPGTLLRNQNLKFICDYTRIRVENSSGAFVNSYKTGQLLNLPIAHGEGNYFCSYEDLAMLKENDCVLFRYCDENGNINPSVNPNGSIENIAGITNKEKNILGMMPHPERASEEILGSADGRAIFHSLNIYMAEVEKKRR
ncbi:MAG: phosphoribosylformylglycinamidine synthase subunit PurQ [Acidobacteria bacterium]|nr:phosphoribosylformylglycinamidine synthase subunit PurQ [Acidobacteriota bacterium]